MSGCAPAAPPARLLRWSPRVSRPPRRGRCPHPEGRSWRCPGGGGDKWAIVTGGHGSPSAGPGTACLCPRPSRACLRGAGVAAGLVLTPSALGLRGPGPRCSAPAPGSLGLPAAAAAPFRPRCGWARSRVRGPCAVGARAVPRPAGPFLAQVLPPAECPVDTVDGGGRVLPKHDGPGHAGSRDCPRGADPEAATRGFSGSPLGLIPAPL